MLFLSTYGNIKLNEIHFSYIFIGFYKFFGALSARMEAFMEDEIDKKDYEIVSGDGTLEISPVYSHVNINKKTDDSDNKKNIVIPTEKK